MSRVAAIVLVVSSVSLGVSAADLQKVIQGTWVVDERARLEASPLYSLSTKAKKKELEASIAVEYVTHASIEMTTKGAGITLILNQAK